MKNKKSISVTVGSFKNRDDPIYKEDAFEIFIRPDVSKKFIYEFEFSPLGVIFDVFNLWKDIVLAIMKNP
ncbi:hypothetical protein KAW50_08215 [candidate division WOR-3 bacterium]|nr:hypothetical protein [candidate division WOR-3 bacterium]